MGLTSEQARELKRLIAAMEQAKVARDFYGERVYLLEQRIERLRFSNVTAEDLKYADAEIEELIACDASIAEVGEACYERDMMAAAFVEQGGAG